MKRRKLHRLIAAVAALAITAGMLGATAPEREDNQAIGHEQEARGVDLSLGLPSEEICIFELQEQPLAAWNVLWENFFEVSGYGRITYPDDFAGGWVDGGNLHIALTSDSSQWGKYRELLADFECVIVFETAQHSLNDLDAIRDFVSAELKEEGYAVVTHYVNEAENRIVFGVFGLDRQIESQINRTLSNLITENQATLSRDNNSMNRLFDAGICTDLFVFEESGHVETRSGMVVTRGGQRITTTRLINGVWTTLHGHSTLGACGWLRQQTLIPGFITHGHELRVGDRKYFNVGIVRFHIGTVTMVNWGENCNYSASDFAFVQATPFAILTNQLLSGSNTREIVAMADPPVRTRVNRMGARTGRGEVEVTARNQPITIDGYTFRATTARIVETPSETGDSGGPFYVPESGNRVRFAGILSASLVSGGVPFAEVFIPPHHYGVFTVRTTP
jgi:hypothetical protein